MSTTPSGVPSARSLFKNVFRSSGLYSIPFLVQPLISFLMTPLVTRHLTTGDYGTLEMLQRAGDLLGLLLGGCFGSSIGYFYFESDQAEDRRRVVGTSVIGAASIGAVVTLVCWLLSGPITRLVLGSAAKAFLLCVMLLNFLPAMALEAMLGWARVSNRVGTMVAGALARSLVWAAMVAILATVFRLDIVGFLSSGVVSNALPAVVLAVICWRAVRPVFDPRLFVRMVKFYAPVAAGGLAVYCINFGDRFFLRQHVSIGDIGLYGLAYKLGMMSILAYNAFNNYWSAQMFDLMKRDDADSLFARMLTYAAGAVLVPCLGLTVFARPVIRIMAHHSYWGAAVFVPAIAFAYGVRCLGDFFRSRFYVAGLPGYDAICNWVGAALCLGGYFYWIPRFGVWGAVLATVVAFAAILAIAAIWTYRIRPYRVEAGRLVKMAVALAAVLAGFVALPGASLAGQLGYGVLLVAGFPGLLWLLRFPTPAEREVVRAVIGRLTARALAAR